MRIPTGIAAVAAAALASACASVAAREAPDAPLAAAADIALLEVFDAERRFAVRAQQLGARDAFLEVMPPDALGFSQGVSEWRALWEGFPRSPPENVLVWRPAYGAASASADYGFDTGPFQAIAGDEVTGRGHYFSVWRRDPGGWALLFDGGVDLDRAASRDQIDALGAHAERWAVAWPGPERDCDAPVPVGEADDALNRLAGSGGAASAAGEPRYRRAAVLRDGASLRVFADAAAADAWPDGAYERSREAVSAARDLAFTFGAAVSAGEDGAETRAGYVRAWRGDGCGWVLEFDVMGS